LLHFGAGVPLIFERIIADVLLGASGERVAIDPHQELVVLNCKGDVSGCGGVELEQLVPDFIVLCPANAKLDLLQGYRCVPLPLASLNYLPGRPDDHLFGYC